jgi:hypothetical protein
MRARALRVPAIYTVIVIIITIIIIIIPLFFLI